MQVPFPPGGCCFAVQKAFGFFTASKLLVWELLLLFSNPGTLPGARGYLQPALSTHIGQSGKRKAALGVLCPSLPQPQGVPAVLQPEMPRAVPPPSEIVPKTPARSEVPWGCRHSLGRCGHSRAPAVVWKEGLQGLRAVQAVISTALQQGCVTEGGSGTARGMGGTCPPGAAPNSHSHTQGL